ncbi:MAG: hypothetical protein PHX83_12980 [Acidobacteriia bacterium]|nr:hypothetical protein [Terriglobia bacterium]
MKKDPKKIAEQIMALVSELAHIAGARVEAGHASKKPFSAVVKKEPSGATGGIRLLADEGKLNSPKQLPEIIELLRQDGRHYSRPTVSMGLLNLVRERVLTRFRDKGDKKWKYALRK